MSLGEHLTTFKEIVSDLETNEVKYDEEALGYCVCYPLLSHDELIYEK